MKKCHFSVFFEETQDCYLGDFKTAASSLIIETSPSKISIFYGAGLSSSGAAWGYVYFFRGAAFDISPYIYTEITLEPARYSTNDESCFQACKLDPNCHGAQANTDTENGCFLLNMENTEPLLQGSIPGNRLVLIQSKFLRFNLIFCI